VAKTSMQPKIPLARQAYRANREKIVTMAYEPGLRLDEKQLVMELGIGRTPVREALLRLASEFLVESEPNRGFVVRPLTVQGVKAMFEALKILEVGAASLALRQGTEPCLSLMREAQDAFEAAVSEGDPLTLVWSNHEFHMHFARCSANDYLIRALADVRNEVNRLAYLSFGSRSGLAGDLLDHYRSVCREHMQIMACLERKDGAGLEETIVSHIRTFQRRVITYMTS